MPSRANICSITPARATVVPRVSRLPDGPPLSIERYVKQMLDDGLRGVIALEGPPGSGCSTAIAHLAEALQDEPRLEVAEVDGSFGASDFDSEKLVIVSGADNGSWLGTLRMVPWCDDDLIEYLLVAQPKHCGSVITRVKQDPDRAALQGLPQLWRMVLDEMADEPSLRFVASALRRRAIRMLEDEACTHLALETCLRRCKRKLDAHDSRLDEPVEKILRHRIIQVLLGGEHLAQLLSSGTDSDELEGLPRELIVETALLVRSRPDAIERLQTLVRRGRHSSPAASILVGADRTWRPADGAAMNLCGAHLSGVNWFSVYLPAATLRDADLRRADLTGASLQTSDAKHASFRQACLRDAKLAALEADGADFGGADLSRACLDGSRAVGANFISAKLGGARLRACDLTATRFDGATLANADFSNSTLVSASFLDADLRGTDFSNARLQHVALHHASLARNAFCGAVLERCDLEEVEIEQPNFSKANLSGCLLTASHLVEADFRDANLSNTGLADIDWEGADLRKADLRGATFHLGSSRSGLVGSTIPCEGSKTGFYTDELDEQGFKSPEEIRKANLKGADLRGAKLKGVDFYLVDVRGARVTRRQRRYLRKCGAILEDGR